MSPLSHSRSRKPLSRSHLAGGYITRPLSNVLGVGTNLRIAAVDGSILTQKGPLGWPLQADGHESCWSKSPIARREGASRFCVRENVNNAGNKNGG